jgi:hypothetical protein
VLNNDARVVITRTLMEDDEEKRREYMYGAISQRSFQRMGTNKTNEEREEADLQVECASRE